MTTRAHDSDPTGSSHAGAQPFAGLGAGLGFFQDWMKVAGAAMPGMSAPTGAGIPGVPSWSVPTLDPDELDKRIQELKTVQFWLEQNSRMIAMTIQGMEVQKMTLSTLQGMNVSMDALRDTLKAQPAPAAAPEAAQETKSTAEPTADAAPNDLINPLHWWDTLTQQFSHLASQASQTAQTVGQSVEASMQDMVAKAQAAAAPAAAAAAEALKPAAPKPRARTAASKTPARKAASKTARKTPPKA